MATKTVTLELDAYDKLKRAKRTVRESFSSVVRRAVFPDTPVTARDLVATLRKRMASGTLHLSEETLDLLDEYQDEPRTSESVWENPSR
ncbi:MAG: antitoxin VapB family protein [Spirochaetales bacterium]|nr:antitoxin VapB family protein [Spirochaetales bacterium]